MIVSQQIPKTYMIQKQYSWRALRSASLALVLAASAAIGQAQTFVNPKTFDTGIGSWIPWNGWGLQGSWLTWDSTQDAANDPNSGSLRYDVPYTGASDDQFMTFGTLHDAWGWDNTTEVNVVGVYTNITFDFKLDPATAPAKDGTFGTLNIGLVTDGWGNHGEGTWSIPASATNWTHVTIPIDPTSPGADKTVGEFINMWSGGNFTNTLSFNVDNIDLQPSTNAAPLPPPTMALEKAGPSGVEIIMDGTGDQWQRNAISTPSGGGPYLWTSQGSYPVTYSCTITNFPDIASHPGFEAHMYLVNGDTAGSGTDVSGSADWGAPDLLIFRVENVVNTVLTTNGTTITTNFTYNAMAQIQWKTNYPNANATNIPVVVYPPSALGTWTVTFTDSTHGTLAGPGITATNFDLPADAVQNNFSPAASFLQFGMFKADGANDGHNNGAHGTYSRVQFTGAQANSFDDAFTGATLTNKYAWRKTDANYVQYITPGTAWIVDWSLPAIQFNPETAAAITGPWNPAVFTSTYRGPTAMHGLVSQTGMSNVGFFRLIKRPFSQLQVLMPGETAAANTPTGKTGTPNIQAVGLPFTVTVNAVDADWNVVPSTDTVDITSSDSTAGLPPDAALVNGTFGFSVYFGQPGTNWTVTATDVTDPTKTANTGSPTVAQ
jgi:hypothetical protein